MKKVLKFLCFFVCGLLLFSATALAYIDPSAVTYMIQLVAGIVIAAGAAFGFYFRRIKRAFSRRGKKDRAQDDWQDDGEDDDDTGFDDYELEPAKNQPAAPVTAAPVSLTAPVAAAPAAADNDAAPAVDKYHENGGESPLAESGALQHLLEENRELRRLLAEERRKVEVLKESLHICTAPKK